jgi:DNA-binding response OmpR family regulator
LPGREPNHTRILVVEDDHDVRSLVVGVLQRAGAETIEAPDGEQALRSFFESRPDLVMLDLGLGQIDGLKVLGRIRDLSDVPVLVLTGEDAEIEKVRALKAGADDYVTKPFGRQELLARVEALLRRRESAAATDSDVLSDSLVSIDFSQATATVAGTELRLTPLEFRLLSTFARHPNQVLSPDQLAELVWGVSGATRDQVKLYIAYLRRKLREAGVQPIETVRGFGYRYRPRSDGNG